MKILGISGGQKNGNNDSMCREALMGAKEMGAEVEFIHLLDLNIKPCMGCVQCVSGPDGIMNGGSCKCILKDDFAWLDEKYLESDGLIIVNPIFEKCPPGVFEVLQDRLAGPSHDTGTLALAKKISESKGTVGPDPRHFKKRFVSFIGIGASDWDCLMEAGHMLFAMSAPLHCVDNLVFNWSKGIVMEDDKIARIREAGRSIARAVMDPDNAKYLGKPGVCPHCHCNVMHLSEDGKTAECSVCGIKGKLKTIDGDFRLEVTPEQLERAHDTMSGKMKHMDDMYDIESKYNAMKKTEEFKKRKADYETFIQPSKPPK